MARKTDIRLRRSATAGNKPSTSDLNLGELALNTYDGAVFLKTHDGSSDAIAVAADARTLSIDYDNKRVGIGTTTPSYKLNVQTAASDANNDWPALFKSYDDKAGIIISDNDTSNYLVSRNSFLSIGSNSDLHANNLNVKSTGEVGIGTITPSHELVIRKDHNANTELSIVNLDSGNNAGTILRFRNDTSASETGNGAFVKLNKFNVFQIMNQFGNPIVFGTNNAEKMRLTSDGNLGIGTNNPTEPLSIHHSDPKIKLQDTDGTQQVGTIFQAGSLLALQSRDGSSNGLIKFQGYNGTTGQEYARFTASGNFGIGTGSPTGGKLVVHTVSGEYGLRLQDSSTHYFRVAHGGNTEIAGDLTIAGNATFNGSLEINHNPLLLDTNPASTYGVSEALRIDDSAGTTDRQLQIFELQHSGARSHRLTFNTNITTDGSAYTYTQGNYGGSSQIEFANNGGLIFYTVNQISGGSTTAITPIERFRINDDGDIRFESGNVFYDASANALNFIDNVYAQFGTGNDLQIYHTGADSYIKNITGDLILDATNDIVLDAGGANINFNDDGTAVGHIEMAGSNLEIKSKVADKDIIFKGNDGGSTVTALTLDMSAAGQMTTNSNIIVGGNIFRGNMQIASNEIDVSDGNLVLDVEGGITLDSNGGQVDFKDNGTLKALIDFTGNNVEIQSRVTDGDLLFRGQDGSSFITALTLDMSDAGSATFNNDVTIGGNLIVNGSTTTINSTTLDVDDLNITVAKGAADSSAASGGGLTIDGAGASLIWDHGNQYLEFNKDVFTPLSFIVGTTSTNVGRMYNSSGVMALEAYTSRQISFGNATNGEHVRIDANGNVGIGTTSPSSGKLVVSGAKTQSGGAPIGNILVADSTALAANVGGGITFQGVYHSGGNITGLAAIEAMKETATHNEYGGALVLKAREDQGAMNEVARFTSTGNLQFSKKGSSFVSPGFTYHTNNYLYLRGGSAGLILADDSNLNTVQIIDGSSGYINFETGDGSSRMRITSTGNVGIGTTSPSTALEIGDGSGSPILTLNKSTTGESAIDFDNAGNIKAKIALDSAETLQFKTGNSSTLRMQITEAGVISFGNNAYSFPTSDGSSGQVLKTDGSGNLSFGSVSAGAATALEDADGDTKIQVEEGTDDDTIRFDTGGTERALFNQNGLNIKNSGGLRIAGTEVISSARNIANVGTITTSSTIKVDPASGDAIVQMEGAGGAQILRLDQNSIRTTTSSDLSIFTSGNTRQIFLDQSAANIGFNMGSDTPHAGTAVHIKGHDTTPDFTATAIDDCTLVLSNSDDDYGTIFGQLGTGTGVIQARRLASAVYYNLALNPHGGKVGINQVAPLRTLEVGGAGATMRVGPDYYTLNGSTDRDYVELQAHGTDSKIVSPNERFHIENSSGNIILNATTIDVGVNTVASANAAADDFVIKGPGTTAVGMTISNSSDAGTGTIFFGDTSSSTAAGFRYNHNTGDLAVSAEDNVTFTCDNVGIGTTSPTGKLHISGNSDVSDEDCMLIIDDVDGSSGSRIPAIMFRSNTGGTVTNQGRIRGTDTQGMVISGSSALGNDLVVQASGVGINTTAPQSKFETNLHSGADSSLMNANSVNDVHLIRAGYGQNAASTTNAGAKWGLRFVGRNDNNYDNGKSGAIFAVSEDSLGYNRKVGLAFHTSSFDASHAERMRIDADGNVVIGATSADAKLRIDQDANTVGLKVTGGGAGVNIAEFVRDVGATASVAINCSSGEPQIQFNDANTFAIGVNSTSFDIADNGHIGTNTRLTIDNTGRIGIGVDPGTQLAKLQVEEYGIDTTTTSTSATTQVAIHTFPVANFRSARFTIQITNSTDSTYHTTELLALHDGTTANITEFGTIFTGAAIEATFDCDVNSGNFRLLATPASTDSMVFKVVSHSITV